MIDAINVLAGALLTIAVSAALGKLLLGFLRLRFRREEDYLFSFVTGAACLSLIVFLLAAVHQARRLSFVLVGVAALGALLARWRWDTGSEPLPPLPKYWKTLFGVVFAVYAYIYFFNAMAPEMSPDGSAYHLGLVARYLEARGFFHITTNMYAYLSQGTEMLFLYAFALGRHSAAALVHFAFLIALVFSMLAYGRRFGFPVVGITGALLFFLSPVVGFDGTTAYIDVAVACVVFAMFYLLQIWDEERNNALLIPIGLLAGFAFAMKYTAFPAVPYAFGFVLWKLWRKRQNPARPVAAMAACAVVMIAPWLIKNWVMQQNPFAPFYNKLFPNPYVHVWFEGEYRTQLEQWGGVTRYRDIPLEVTKGGDKLQGALGPVFLLAPIALLALRRRQGRQLLLAGLVFFVTYPSNIGTRFLISCLPFVSLAMGMALGDWKWAPARWLPALVIASHAYTAFPTVVKNYCHIMRLDRVPIRAALRIIPEKAYLEDKMWGYSVGKMVEAKVPPESKVLCYSAPPEAYTMRELLVGYEGAFNQNASDLLSVPLIADWQPTRRLTFRFAPRVVRRIRLAQDAPRTHEMWSVSEFRVFLDKKELPRQPQWRVMAKPNPWEVQAAFDNNPLTRWRSWQDMASGQFIEIDFGRLENIDHIEIDTTPDFHSARFSIMGQYRTDQGWDKLSASPEETRVKMPENLRQIATSEIKWEGIEYLLINDDDAMAQDMRKNAKDWGVKLAGEARNTRLYRIE